MSYTMERPGFSDSYHGGDVPAGYLLCDGSAIPRSVYAALFAAIGVAHGSGDGVATFNLPDSRGYLERFVDSSGTGRDPDLASRTAMAPGGNTGASANPIGSTQPPATGGHFHEYSEGQGGGPGDDGSSGNGSLYGGNHTANTTGAVPGGDETRPLNYYATKMIKY